MAEWQEVAEGAEMTERTGTAERAEGQEGTQCSHHLQQTVPAPELQLCVSDVALAVASTHVGPLLHPIVQESLSLTIVQAPMSRWIVAEVAARRAPLLCSAWRGVVWE